MRPNPKSPIAFFRQHTNNLNEEREQERTRSIAARLNAIPFALGKLVTIDVVQATGSAAGGSVVLAHGLGTQAALMMVRCRAGLVVAPYESSSQSDLDSTKQVRVVIGVTSGNPVVDLWVYPAASLVTNSLTGIGL